MARQFGNYEDDPTPQLLNYFLDRQGLLFRDLTDTRYVSNPKEHFHVEDLSENQDQVARR